MVIKNDLSKIIKSHPEATTYYELECVKKQLANRILLEQGLILLKDFRLSLDSSINDNISKLHLCKINHEDEYQKIATWKLSTKK